MLRFILGQAELHVLKNDYRMRCWYRRIRVRRGSKIARMAEAAVRTAGNKVLGTLAAAQAETGRFREAVSTINRALAMIPRADGNTTRVAELERFLRIYQRGEPFRSTPVNSR